MCGYVINRLVITCSLESVEVAETETYRVHNDKYNLVVFHFQQHATLWQWGCRYRLQGLHWRPAQGHLREGAGKVLLLLWALAQCLGGQEPTRLRLCGVWGPKRRRWCRKGIGWNVSVRYCTFVDIDVSMKNICITDVLQDNCWLPCQGRTFHRQGPSQALDEVRRSRPSPPAQALWPTGPLLWVWRERSLCLWLFTLQGAWSSQWTQVCIEATCLFYTCVFSLYSACIMIFSNIYFHNIIHKFITV